MIKKFFLIVTAIIVLNNCAAAQTDKLSEDYLKNKKHFAIMNPFAECVAQSVIKKSIKKEVIGKYKVKFEGYTLSSMKQGVFKYLEITGKNMNVDGVEVPYINIKTVNDYNRVDYTKNPPIFLSDMDLYFDLHLSEKSINDALSTNEYKKVIARANKYTYPFFSFTNVRTEIKENRIKLYADYYLPISMSKKTKTLKITTDFSVVNGVILANNTDYETMRNNPALSKLTDIINLFNPLTFTLKMIESKNCNGKIENLKIVDNIIQINGKIFVKGES